jgi:hypothetical protein
MNLSQCPTCQIYRNGCSVHPQDVMGDDCLDFRLRYEVEKVKLKLTCIEKQVFLYMFS